FLINIAVTLHIIPISRFTITADRYVYISTIAIAFILNKLLIDYLEKPEWFRGAVAVLGITYLFCLAGYTAYRIPVWQDSDTLKEEIKTIIEGREDYDELLENQKN